MVKAAWDNSAEETPPLALLKTQPFAEETPEARGMVASSPATGARAATPLVEPRRWNCGSMKQTVRGIERKT